jgi:hypothetical protein
MPFSESESKMAKKVVVYTVNEENEENTIMEITDEKWKGQTVDLLATGAKLNLSAQSYHDESSVNVGSMVFEGRPVNILTGILESAAERYEFDLSDALVKVVEDDKRKMQAPFRFIKQIADSITDTVKPGVSGGGRSKKAEDWDVIAA